MRIVGLIGGCGRICRTSNINGIQCASTLREHLASSALTTSSHVLHSNNEAELIDALYEAATAAAAAAADTTHDEQGKIITTGVLLTPGIFAEYQGLATAAWDVSRHENVNMVLVSPAVPLSRKLWGEMSCIYGLGLSSYRIGLAALPLAIGEEVFKQQFNVPIDATSASMPVFSDNHVASTSPNTDDYDDDDDRRNMVTWADHPSFKNTDEMNFIDNQFFGKSSLGDGEPPFGRSS